MQQLLRSNFNKFDLYLAFIGLLSLVEAFIYNIHILTTQNNLDNFSQWVFRSALSFLQLSLFFGSENSDIFIFLIFTLFASIFYYLFTFWVQIFISRNLSISKRNLTKILLAIFHSATYFSNSFIIYESMVLRFLSQFLLLWIFIDYFLKNK